MPVALRWKLSQILCSIFYQRDKGGSELPLSIRTFLSDQAESAMEAANRTARIFQILIGLVYLVSGAIKTWEPILFYWEAIPYTQLLGFGREYFQPVAKGAVLLAPFEVGLGVALVFNWLPRFTLPVATLLMAFFTGLLTYAWKMGASIDCGCFGALVERSPGEAAVEDAVMLCMLGFALLRSRSVERLPWTPQGIRYRGIAPGLYVLALIVCGIRFLPEVERLEASDLKSDVRLIGLYLKGVDADLQKGKYLIELFSPVCGHCINAVPKINAMAQDDALPRVIALTSFSQESNQLVEFERRFNPLFDIATVSLTDFYRLTYAHGYPRLAYIKDGVVQSVWERDFMPDIERLREITR